MWSWKKSRRSLGMLRPYGRIYRPWLVKGTLATVGLVLLRLALPWPLKGRHRSPDAHHHPKHTHLAWVPSFGDPVLWFVGGFVLLVLLVGIAEMLQRICMAKFATHTVHDLRAAAVRGAARRGGQEDPGELIARIIGDAARIKESLKGILIHASQNGLLFLGVAVVFLFISPKLSAYFFAGGLIAIGIGVYTSSRVATVFRKQRKKEGAYATALFRGLENDSLDLDRLNQSSATKDVRITKMMTLSSLVVHVALAATTGIAVWAGSGQVKAGTLSAGDLFLFITYALTVHHRVVQVGRQLSRSGKVMACVDRIGSLIDESAPDGAGRSAPRRLVAARRRGIGRPRRTARPCPQGRVARSPCSARWSRASRASSAFWPGSSRPIGDGSAGTTRISRSGPSISWRAWATWARRRPSPAHGSGGSSACRRGSPAPETLDLLKKVGAWPIVERLPRGLKEKVGSPDLSRDEARILRMGAILLGSAPCG
jgi:hypothetical protein